MAGIACWPNSGQNILKKNDFQEFWPSMAGGQFKIPHRALHALYFTPNLYGGNVSANDRSKTILDS